MKKDRNSFFSEYNMNAYNSTPVQPMYQNMYTQPQVQSQSSFYSGPVPANNQMQYDNNMNYGTYTTDIESRISKIERQINRIESRLNKIENELTTNTNTIDNIDSTFKNNMYMV